MPGADELRALLARVEGTKIGDDLRGLDRALWLTLRLGGVVAWPIHRYSTSLNSAKWLAAQQLPGFWHSTTTCWRTADADVAPDFTGPHGDDLLAAGWSIEEHDAITFSAVHAPGGPIHAECLALIAATLKALIAKEALVPPSLEMLVKRRTALAFMKTAPARSALITQEGENGR